MVQVTTTSVQRTGLRRLRGGGKGYDRERLGVVVVAVLAAAFVVWFLADTSTISTTDDTTGMVATVEGRENTLRGILTRGRAGPRRPDLHVRDPNAENYNAIAMDIRKTLECDRLLNITGDTVYASEAEAMGAGPEGEEQFQQQREKYRRRRRRRLQGEDGGEDFGVPPDGDAAEALAQADVLEDMGDDAFIRKDMDVTGETLFCMAAYPATDATLTDAWKGRLTCDAAGNRQVPLLELWSAARAEMPEEVLKRALQVATEQRRELAGGLMMAHLWAPALDDGVEFMLSEVNDPDKNVDHGGIHGLQESLGRNRLFVDVGSCLGVTGMAVSLLYPETKIVSFEAASPNWLYQEMNWRCHEKFDNVDRTIVLSGVGPTSATGGAAAAQTQMAKFLWRPSATTSTRAWTPRSERQPEADLELTVRLRPWHALLQETGLLNDGIPIDVLNVDCEGCEYNLIPALSDREFESMRTVMGGIHWGYIPEHKLPSSERGRRTHERLCRHENFARTAKECCAFPDLPVISSVQGEVLVRDEGPGLAKQGATVRDVAGDLCDNFYAWAEEHHLNSIDSDWGWFQISSVAD